MSRVASLVGVLFPFWVSSGFTIRVAVWLLDGCGILLFFLLIWQAIFFSQQESLTPEPWSWLSPVSSYSGLLKKFNIFILPSHCLLAFIVSDEKSDIYLIGFSCMQRTFFLLLFAGFYLRLAIFLLLYIWMWFFLYFFLTCSLLSCFDMYANVFHQIYEVVSHYFSNNFLPLPPLP